MRRAAVIAVITILPTAWACLATDPGTTPSIPNCSKCEVPANFYRDDVLCPNFGQVQGVSCEIVPKAEAFNYSTGVCLEAFMNCPGGSKVLIDAEGLEPKTFDVEDFDFRIRCSIEDLGKWLYTTSETDMGVLVNSLTCYIETPCTGCTTPLRAGDPTNPADCPPGYICQPFDTAPGVGMEEGCATFTGFCGDGVDYIFKLVGGTFDVITYAQAGAMGRTYGPVCLSSQWSYIHASLGIYYTPIDSVTCGVRQIG